MASYRILRATPEHIGTLMALWTDFETARGWTPSVPQAQAFGDAVWKGLYDEDERVWVAVVGKRVVGFLRASFCPQSYSRFPAVIDVGALYVRPEYRDRRIGGALDRMARLWARERKATVAFTVRAEDVPRWQRRGFEAVAVVMMGEG